MRKSELSKDGGLFFCVSKEVKLGTLLITLSSDRSVPFSLQGLRASALLSLLSSNEPEPCPLSPEPSQELSISDTSSLPGSTAALCSPPSSLFKTLSAEEAEGKGQLVSQDTLDSPSLSTEDTLSPELRGETAWHVAVYRMENEYTHAYDPVVN